MVSAPFLRFFVGMCILCSASCGPERSDEKTTLPGDDRVLARVNGAPITAFDVQRAIEQTFGKEGAPALDDEARRKVLESLITSRAIALAREKELSAEERARLDKHVAAQREEKLVRDYLTRHSPPRPVTSEMVERYYSSHQDRFSGEAQRSYELILSERELNSQERDALIAALGQPAKESDWRALADNLKLKGLPVTYNAGSGNESALHPVLADAITKLGVGQASSLLFVQNRAYAARVTAIQRPMARPLSEVSEQIREILTPVQVKEALKAAGTKTRQLVKIEYPGP